MFGVNWSDPQTLWLNTINLSLGLVTVVCCAAIGYGVLLDLRERARKRAFGRAPDLKMGAKVGGLDGHAFEMPGLGMTMADGGEPLQPPAATHKASAKTLPKSVQ